MVGKTSLFCVSLSVPCCSVFSFVFARGLAKVQVWGCDVDVKYVHKMLLITWIMLFRKLIFMFNVHIKCLENFLALVCNFYSLDYNAFELAEGYGWKDQSVLCFPFCFCVFCFVFCVC